MKSFDTELKKYADKVSLKASERRELRERILSYMEYHPLPKQVLDTAELASGIPGEAFTTFHFTMFHARVTGAALVLVLILAPFMAERAVPGDVLYLVKTGFNETLQKQLIDSPYEKIEFETKLMERRISEARSLAQEGKLTEEVKTQLAETVKGHTTAVRTGLTELRTQDADGAAIAEIAFNSSLEVQSAVLDADQSVGNDSLIQGIRTVVNEARDEVVLNQDGNKPSFGGLMARVELETTRVYELFETVKASAKQKEIRDIERRLNDIERLVGKAKERQTVDEEKAANDLATTLGLIQKLIVFMTDINVRETVALETLVPVVLSDEERTQFAKERLDAIGVQVADVSVKLDAVEDTDVKNKVEEGLGRTTTLTGDAALALERADIGAAESFIAEAGALVADLGMMTAQGGVGIAAVEDVTDSPDDATATMMVDDTGGETTATTTPVETEEPESEGQGPKGPEPRNNE
jgi:tetrahydromethanopterin S-methyltransferase subunit G